MPKSLETIKTADLDKIKSVIANVVLEMRKAKDLSYADVRVGVAEAIASHSEDGQPKTTSADWSLAIGTRVISKKGMAAAGYGGKQLGANDFQNFTRVLKEIFRETLDRARANSVRKRDFVRKAGTFGKSIRPTELAPIEIHQDQVLPVFKIDPRQVSQKQITDFVCQASLAAKKQHQFIRRAEAMVFSEIARQIFASSEGGLIDHWACATGGTIFVLAKDNRGNKPVDLYHHTGNQLGFEALSEGKNAHQKRFSAFCRDIAQEAADLSSARPAPETKKPVTVVLDPDLVALFAHEIIGHPSELDRALKMETGYAGRSWFLSDLKNTLIGKRIGSPLLTAFSDPTLKGGYGSYLYDDEGAKAGRVYHIKDGVFQDFMNSRQTAALIGSRPNGHYKASSAALVPLIRMSVSAIASGSDDPAKIISQVEEGFYCVGHRIPSISESRENFEIAPRLIYEIRHGKIGRVLRDGRLRADSKDFFTSIDAVGNDFKIFPIPNCGKGQPMQSKQVGNGGPTIRARAHLAKG